MKTPERSVEEIVEEACQIVEEMMEDEENWKPIVTRIKALTHPNNPK